VRATTERLNLDIETVVNPSAESRSYFEAFDGLVASYRSIGLSDTLYSFVKWVADVQSLEKYSPRPEDSSPGVVQVLTVHSAKGLEWDAVAIPRWSSMIPRMETTRANELGWLNEGSLPHPFRPDALYLPHLAIENLATIEAAEKAIAAYGDELKEDAYLAERRRVRYVAITRAAEALMISGSFYNATSSTPTPPDTWWGELEAAHHIPPHNPEVCTETNPNLDESVVASWPTNPFGSVKHEATVHAAARLVNDSNPDAPTKHDHEIERLLAESRAEQTATVPTRIPASRYAEWSTNLDAVREGSRRPVPTRPFAAARVGNEVHVWIERGAPGEDRFDVDHGSDDVVELDTPIEKLKETYLASRWRDAHCLHKEIEILLPQGRHIIVCKIDAVYEIDGRITIVDWKTGAKPTTESEKDAKAMQIVLYRRALSALTGTPAADIDCYLFYLAHNWEWNVEPSRLDRLDALPPID
jgi:DNA helicase-2/ATP-dependent DNA helicase PcrA